MGQIDTNTRTTILLCLGAQLASILGKFYTVLGGLPNPFSSFSIPVKDRPGEPDDLLKSSATSGRELGNLGAIVQPNALPRFKTSLLSRRSRFQNAQ
jgi:hypothetical protein